MFQYRCTACGVSAYSSASYATVGVCPSCGSSLADEEFVTVPEPGPVAETRRWTRAVHGSANPPARRSVASGE